jgi:hypothetical protein
VIWEDRDKSLLRPLWQKYLGQGPPGEARDLLRLAMRGTLEPEMTPGGGLTMTISLPAAVTP